EPGDRAGLADALDAMLDGGGSEGDASGVDRRRRGFDIVAGHTWEASARRHMAAYRFASGDPAPTGGVGPGPQPVGGSVVRSLITGGRGFVGQWMASHLRELGDDVVCIDREVEITDAVALLAALTDAAPEAISHLAALTHVGQSWDEPLRVLEVNVIGTGALLAAARQCGSDPRVLVTSSAEVYGAVTDPGLLPLREDSP